MRNPRLLLCLPALLLLAVSPGCLFSEGDSCDAAIGGISLDGDVFNTEDGIVARAYFEFGDMSGLGGTSLRLCETDSVTINGEATREVDPLSGRIYYEVEFSEEQDEYEFRFSRDGEEDVVATVEMPPDFSLDAPVGGSELSRADGLTIEWSPGWDGEQMEIDMNPGPDTDNHTCQAAKLELVDDTGSYTYAPSELVNDDEDATESCAVGVILTRTQEGTYPSEFEAGGKVEAWRSWAVEYVSNP